MSKAKSKGYRLEKMITDQLNANGITAERTPLSGSLGGKYAEDVIIGNRTNIIKKIECKNRETISKSLWEWLENNNYLMLKRNNHKPLVVMTLDEFIELYKR